jgi:hypothetical protein
MMQPRFPEGGVYRIPGSERAGQGGRHCSDGSDAARMPAGWPQADAEALRDHGAEVYRRAR